MVNTPFCLVFVFAIKSNRVTNSHFQWWWLGDNEKYVRVIISPLYNSNFHSMSYLVYSLLFTASSNRTSLRYLISRPNSVLKYNILLIDMTVLRLWHWHRHYRPLTIFLSATSAVCHPTMPTGGVIQRNQIMVLLNLAYQQKHLNHLKTNIS